MEKYIMANVRTFCSALGGKAENFSRKAGSGRQWSVPQNMSDWCNYLTFDVMGDLCFGKAFEMLENPQNRHVIDLIGSAAHMHLIVSLQFRLIILQSLIKTAWDQPSD
jgi:hypothetical protein